MSILASTLGCVWAYVGPLVVLYFFSATLYHYHISPLRHIPGPWYTAISSMWLTSQALRMQQSRAIHSLFEIYGPIVRIAPNKVAFRDAISNTRIYNNSKFRKSSFYQGFLTNGSDHAMSMLSHDQHAIHRRSFMPHYTRANVALLQPEMHDYALDVVEILESYGRDRSVDILHLSREMLVDLICEASFHYRIGALRARANQHREHPLVRAIDDFPKCAIIRSIFPAWLWDCIRTLPNDRWRSMCDSDHILAKFIGDRVQEKLAETHEGELADEQKKTLLERLLEYRTPSGEALAEADIVSELEAHFIAGVDTTSTALSYTLWEISRRSDVADKLHAELDSVMHDRRTLPEVGVLEKLPYLNAVVRETLRLYGPGPSLLERVVPEFDRISGHFELLGRVLPTGTVIGTQSWSLHRDTTVFPSPETYLPDRWLMAGETELRRMDAHWMPFGSGTRICGGMAFAQQDIRIAVALLARNFDISADAGQTNARTMHVREAFVAFPAAMRCELQFKLRQS